ncbi:DUF2164 domain-containing protein [Vibrio sp. Isolate25]|uniref:DUF2164 domain-containing protein n=1 Tax=unclassified Vibrio TaxID=2614977 RepID=UPI001EFC4E1F|nr:MULTISPECIES: DUF2164 domain-containing protein [unclassified Vibrio]MCG9595659.1 DUF2164 domain-containing protein [Vibrio sp. Isolate25]MCG9677156.1 DUF2164 domain-containing protein [Vibrio sp. Isolate24]MCG9682265.1 DUF2164 domain-containing protein [Vibrio sp. Isolate23]
MSKIEFTSQQKQAMSSALLRYLEDELDIEIGQFDADFFIDFITETFGPAFYNKGLADAQAVMQKKMLDIADELYEIEQVSDF